MTVEIKGNLTADPELRFTRTGKKVTTVTVAQNHRFFDPTAGDWKDGAVVFMRCNVWDEMAENVVATLKRGMRVVVIGELQQNKVTNDDGEIRTYTDVRVDEIGPSLRFATAEVKKVARDVTDPRDVEDADAPSDPHETSPARGNGKAKVPF